MPPIQGRLKKCHRQGTGLRCRRQRAGLRGAAGKGQALEVPPAGAGLWIEQPTRGGLWKESLARDEHREVPPAISGLWKVPPAEGGLGGATGVRRALGGQHKKTRRGRAR